MKKRKILSLVLSVAMMMQLCLPAGASTADEPAVDGGAGESACTHHTAHTPECGDAVTFASDINDLETQDSWKDVAFEGDGGTVDGTQDIMLEDADEVIAYENNIASDPAVLNVSGGNITIYSCGTLCRGHILRGTTTQYTVTVNGGTHDIILDSLNVDVSRSYGACAFHITGSATVNLTLLGSSVLKSGDHAAGMRINQSNVLTVMEHSVGSLEAYGGGGSPGIGSEGNTNAGMITIAGGTIAATGGLGAAGIGGGQGSGSCGEITVQGGNVTATGGFAAAGIGDGYGGGGGKIAILGGVVSATSRGGAGIGLRNATNSSISSIDITGGTITAVGAYSYSFTYGSVSGPGIGSNPEGRGVTVNISGGTIQATGGSSSAGIGVGYFARDSNINPGTCGDIMISGGNVTAVGGGDAPAIGTGYFGHLSGAITIEKDAVVFAKAGSGQTTHIGTVEGRPPATVNRNGGMIVEGILGKVYGDGITLRQNIQLGAGETIVVSPGQTITVPKGITFTNEGNLYLDRGNINGEGTLDGSGYYEVVLDSEDIQPIPDQVYTGARITPPHTLNKTRVIMGTEFDVDRSNFRAAYVDNTEVGTARLLYTGHSSYSEDVIIVEKTFQILPSATTFEGGVKMYKDGTLTTTFAYGDTITVKAKPRATGTMPSGATLLTAAPGPNQMALYLGETQISDAATRDDSGVYTMTYDTSGKHLVLGYNTITVKYVGTTVQCGTTADVQVTLLPKALTSTEVSGGSKVYDGSAGFADLSLTLTGVAGGDITATASGSAAAADVGTHAFTATSVNLSGADTDYYILPLSAVSGSVTITPRAATVTISGGDKVYDGTTDATVRYTVSGALTGDILTASGSAAFGDKDVGAGKTVTATGITLGGAKAGNYTLNGKTTATTTATIAKKALIWSNGTVNNKTYDGGTSATIATPPALVGVIGSEVTVQKGSAAFASADVGTHAVTASGYGVIGNDKGNYTVPMDQPAFAKGSISAKEVANPAINITSSHVFNGEEQIPTFTVTDGSTVIPASNYTVSCGTNINAGTGTVKVTLKGNYTGNATANFTIEKAEAPTQSDPTPILMTQGLEKKYTIPLPGGMDNAGAVSYTVSEPSGDAVFSVRPVVEGTSLTFTSSGGAAVGNTATATVTVSSTNYADYTVKLTFQITSKTKVVLSGLSAAPNLVYTGNDQTVYSGTLMIDGRALTPEEQSKVTYTYVGIHEATATAPIDAGNYNLLVTIEGETYSGSHPVISFTIGKAPVTVEQGGYTVSKDWDGTTSASGSGNLKVTGTVNGETVTVTPIPRDYPSSNVSSSHSVIVDLTLSGDKSANYSLANNTITVTGAIKKTTVPPGALSAPTAMISRDTSITLQPLFVEGEAVEYAVSTTNAAPTDGWQDETVFTGLTPFTTYYFFARVKENDNHVAGDASDGTKISTVKSIHTPVAPRNIILTNGEEHSGTITLETVFGVGKVPDGAAFGAISAPGSLLVVDTFDIVNGELTYTRNENDVSTSATDVFTIVITSTRYEDITLTVAFTATDKIPAIITATLESKVYDGKPMVLPAVSVSPDLPYTHWWMNGSTNLGENPPTAVGEYQLVISINSATHQGSLTIPFVIAKRALTITAKSASILAGAEAPAYDFTAEGLADNESLTGVTVTCGYKNDGSASSAKGNYPITVSGGTVSGGNANYAITYVPGTLTVTLDTTALDNAIAAAKAVKDGILTSDKDASQIDNGTRFVSTKVMAALDAALTGAEESKASATTKEQITVAADTLNEATDTFKTAIQTGSYVPSTDSGWVPPKKPQEPHKPTTEHFTDVKGHWAEESIKFVVAEGLFNGISDSSFAPEMTMTRGMLVTVLYRQAGSPAANAEGTAWYAPAQAWARQAGISDGSRMESEMTREQLVTMLHRYAKQMGVDVSVGEDTNILSYNDAFDVSAWAIPAFQWACGAGIVKGVDGDLLPDATATRAEVAAMLMRFIAQ